MRHDPTEELELGQQYFGEQIWVLAKKKNTFLCLHLIFVKNCILYKIFTKIQFLAFYRKGGAMNIPLPPLPPPPPHQYGSMSRDYQQHPACHAILIQ